MKVEFFEVPTPDARILLERRGAPSLQFATPTEESQSPPPVPSLQRAFVVATRNMAESKKRGAFSRNFSESVWEGLTVRGVLKEPSSKFAEGLCSSNAGGAFFDGESRAAQGRRTLFFRPLCDLCLHTQRRRSSLFSNHKSPSRCGQTGVARREEATFALAKLEGVSCVLS